MVGGYYNMRKPILKGQSIRKVENRGLTLLLSSKPGIPGGRQSCFMPEKDGPFQGGGKSGSTRSGPLGFTDLSF